MRSVIHHHSETAAYRYYHLGRFTVRMASAGFAVRDSVYPENTFNLEGYLMRTLGKRQCAAVIDRFREFYYSASARELFHIRFIHINRKDNAFFWRMLFFQK